MRTAPLPANIFHNAEAEVSNDGDGSKPVVEKKTLCRLDQEPATSKPRKLIYQPGAGVLKAEVLVD